VAGNSAGWGASAATTIGTKGTSDPETGPEGIGGRAGVNMVDLCGESSSRNKCRAQRAWWTAYILLDDRLVVRAKANVGSKKRA
jgi:hypothetical protein